MARINVEDGIEATAEWDRLMRLLGSDKARGIGLLVLFWRHAQRLWGRGELVSDADIAEWGWEPLVQSGWARKQDGGYYAIGAKEQFRWYVQRVGAAHAGGKAGGRGRSSDSRDDDSDSRNMDSDSPLLPSYLLYSNTLHAPRSIEGRLEEAYKTYPAKKGKTRGFAKLKKEIRTETDFRNLLAAIEKYKKSDDVKRGFVKHFSTFAGEWRDWLDPDAGKVSKPGGSINTIPIDVSA